MVKRFNTLPSQGNIHGSESRTGYHRKIKYGLPYFLFDFFLSFLYTNNSRVGGYMTEERQVEVRNLIDEYVKDKGLDSVAEMLQAESKETGSGQLSAVYKILLQQMIRERAKQDGRDIDTLIQEEQQVSPQRQTLGVMTRVESSYVDVLLKEAEERKETPQGTFSFLTK